MRQSDLLNQAFNIGMAFYGQILPVKEQLIPEEVIIQIVREIVREKDLKLLSILVLWMNNFRGYVRAELMKKLSYSLHINTLAVLGGVIQKSCIKDHRWDILIKHIAKHTKNNRFSLNPRETNCEADLEMLGFGVDVRKVSSADEKKIMQEDWVIKNNIWIRNRLFLGTNLRADVRTVIQYNLVETPYRCRQLLSCSQKAAYDNWNSLMRYQNLEKEWLYTNHTDLMQR